MLNKETTTILDRVSVELDALSLQVNQARGLVRFPGGAVLGLVDASRSIDALIKYVDGKRGV